MDIQIIVTLLKNLAILTAYSCGLIIGGVLVIRLIRFIVYKTRR